MKASELRIGNKIQYSDDGTEFEVEQIYSDGLDVKNENEEVYIEIEYFGGIRITEEWLLKFGFKKDLEDTIYKNINSNSFLCWYNNKVELLEDSSESVISRAQYVHQLQNLYFALTGKELQLK